MSPLPRGFYSRDTVEVARDLLGKRIVRMVDGSRMTCIITETEAYKHKEDPASHAHGRITRRNSVMFGQVGVSYVYFTYGMHFCFNVVARDSDTLAGAVLIRAASPESGITRMQKNRGIDGTGSIAGGPARLAQAMEITKEQYGVDLTSDGRLYIEDGVPVSGAIRESPRVGIRVATDRMWNFAV